MQHFKLSLVMLKAFLALKNRTVYLLCKSMLQNVMRSNIKTYHLVMNR
jgi:hypothetical protein